MSNIYIQEPPTNGKVLLETTVGDIDLELWCKETPKACHNFIQLCMEGYYNGTIFHRVVPGFIVQGGDPTGTGEGGQSIYGAPFKDELHSRLRFTRRGLLAMANAGRDDNGSQFFFTLAAAPELHGKHTIFGKVAGHTLYNMLKLEDGELEDDRPVYPHKILRTQVLLCPFDIIPRVKEVLPPDTKPKPKSKSAATKNFKLLSFGDEAEEDEDQAIQLSRRFSGKSKSSHDLTDDPRLSSAPAVPEAVRDDKRSRTETDADMDELRKKLRTAPSEPARTDTYRLFQEDDQRKQAQISEARTEFEQLKKEMTRKSKVKEKPAAADQEAEPSEAVREYRHQNAQFEEKKKDLPKRGASSREAQTMALLEKFKKKLQRARDEQADHEPGPTAAEPDGGDREADEEADQSWMVHELHFSSSDPVLAKDANARAEDWYDIYDPRNEMNKRRRESDARRGRTARRGEV